MRCINVKCRQARNFYAVVSMKETKKLLGLRKIIEIHKVKIPLEDPDTDISVFSDSIIQCVDCSAKMNYWDSISAYENPMLYFDTCNLCACGGEIWNDIEYVEQDKIDEDLVGYQREVKFAFRCDVCGETYDTASPGKELK